MAKQPRKLKPGEQKISESPKLKDNPHLDPETRKRIEKELEKK